jgi:hypothetical protein
VAVVVLMMLTTVAALLTDLGCVRKLKMGVSYMG